MYTNSIKMKYNSLKICFGLSEMVVVNLYNRKLWIGRNDLKDLTPVLELNDSSLSVTDPPFVNDAFIDRYCAQYLSMELDRISYKLPRIITDSKREAIGTIYYTFDEQYHAIPICLMDYNSFVVMGKIEELNTDHYHIKGFNQPEPYYAYSVFPKIARNENAFSISLNAVRPNPFNYYGHYLKRNLPLFFTQAAAQLYAKWLEDTLNHITKS